MANPFAVCQSAVVEFRSDSLDVEPCQHIVESPRVCAFEVQDDIQVAVLEIGREIAVFMDDEGKHCLVLPVSVIPSEFQPD